MQEILPFCITTIHRKKWDLWKFLWSTQKSTGIFVHLIYRNWLPTGFLLWNGKQPCSWQTPCQLDKLEITPLRVVVSYGYLVFSQPPACLHQAM